MYKTSYGTSILRITLTAFTLLSLFMDNETQLLKQFGYVNTSVSHRWIMVEEITYITNNNTWS